jgi:hypothetical protein
MTTNLKNSFLTVTMVMAFMACNSASKDEAFLNGSASAEEKVIREQVLQDSIASAGSSALDKTLQIKAPEKIIKTADIDLRVDDYSKSRVQVEQMIRSGNAFIAHENETHDTYRTANTMTIRVLNKDFDSLVSKLVTVAKEVNFKKVNTQDVTAQFVDIQARLKTKKEIEQRYIDLLQKATRITDILEIEEKIRVIREEIEAKEGELKYLGDQVALSTINLSFYQTFEYEAINKPGFFNRVGSALGSGWQGFLGFIVGFLYVWPLWIVLGVGGWFLYRFIKRLASAK